MPIIFRLKGNKDFKAFNWLNSSLEGNNGEVFLSFGLEK